MIHTLTQDRLHERSARIALPCVRRTDAAARPRTMRATFAARPRAVLRGSHRLLMARAGSGRDARRLTPYGAVPGDEALRVAHLDAVAACDVAEEVDHEVLEEIDRLKLGRRKGSLTAARMSGGRHFISHSHVGLVLVPKDPMPALPSKLPEVALVGRSNTGKSALLNALCGVKPKAGHASVSPRAGHTSALNFYELRDGTLADSAIMTLVDLPGYGPSVGRSESMRREWGRATRRYLSGRPQLACAFVLIDASLGVTPDDCTFLDELDAMGSIRYHCVLTKADLLTPRELAISYELVRAHVMTRPGHVGGDMPITSARNAAGVRELWERMRQGIEAGLHEMSDDERHAFVEDVAAGGDGLQEDGAEEDEDDRQTLARLERMLRRRGIRPIYPSDLGSDAPSSNGGGDGVAGGRMHEAEASGGDAEARGRRRRVRKRKQQPGADCTAG